MARDEETKARRKAHQEAEKVAIKEQQKWIEDERKAAIKVMTAEQFAEWDEELKNMETQAESHFNELD